MIQKSFSFFILFSICLSLLFAGSAQATGDKNADGAIDDTALAAPAISGLVIGEEGGSAGEQARQMLSGLGYSVSLVYPEDITEALLADEDFLFIVVAAVSAVHAAGKSSLIQSFVSDGGGLIVEQPNEEGSVPVVPYSFVISDHDFDGECEKTVLNPSHEIVAGLSDDDMMNCYDTVGSISPQWEVLVQDGTGDPSLSVASYGAGRVIIELGRTKEEPTCSCDGTFGYVCMTGIMLQRMVDWVVSSELTRINLTGPADLSTPGAAPTFSWEPNGGSDNRYVIDFHIPGVATRTTPVLSSATWSLPTNIWNVIPTGRQIFWRVRGADLDHSPLTVVISDEIWSFYR